MISAPDVRADLAAAMALDPEFEDLRARMVARFLDGLPQGSRVLLSGCGGVARRLAEAHAASLARHNAAFTDGSVPDGGSVPDDSTAGARSEFHGFPLLPTSGALAFDPAHALLLTCTFEPAMRARLAGLPAERLFGLLGLVREQAGDADRLEALARMQAMAESLLSGLASTFAPGDKTVAIVEPDLCGSNLSLLKHLRAHGWKVALFIRRNAQISRPVDRLIPEGYADWLFEAPSFDGLRLLMPFLLARHAFSVTWVTVFAYALPFVDRCISASAGPVVILYDTFLSQIMEDKAFAEGMHRRGTIGGDEVHRLEGRVLRGSAGMFHRHPDFLNERYGSRHGCRIKALKLLHPMDPPSGQPPARFSAADGRLHVVSIFSLHKDPMVTVHTAHPISCIFEPIEALTGAGIRFTVINPLDPGWDHDYDMLRTLAEENPLFEYRTAMPFDRLLELLPRYDFGWTCRRIPRVEIEYTRTHLPYMLFAFLHARVPVLVSPETEYLAELVRGHGAGLVLPADEWARAGEKLAAFDRAAYDLGVERWAAELDTGRQAARIAAFLGEILAGDRTRPLASQGERP
jgi:hypothetical protein